MIALTGATGFLGGHVTKALARQAVPMRALVRDPKRAKHLLEQSIELVEGDLENPDALEQLVRSCSCVIHIAGAVKARTPERLRQINEGGTANLVAACAKCNPDIRLVHISSITAREPSVSPYAMSKAASEASATVHTGPVVLIRPNAVYGPCDHETLQVFVIASGFLHPVVNQPKARIAMIHGRDAANAIAALSVNSAPTGLFEIGDTRMGGYSWHEITKSAVRAVGGKYRPISIAPIVLQTAGLFSELTGHLRKEPPIFNRGKVREILHGDWSVQASRQVPAGLWQAKFSLDDGFDNTVAWYRQQGWLR